jgi:CRP-like cAMP-binding protein
VSTAEDFGDVAERNLHVAPGDTLFEQGDGCTDLLLIREGRVALERIVDGACLRIAELGPGDFLGEESALGDQPLSCTATAMTATHCLRLDRQALNDLIAQSTEINVRLLRGLAQRLAQRHELLDRFAQRDAPSRFCQALARHAQAYGQPEDGGIVVTRRISDVAREVALRDDEVGVLAQQLIAAKILRVNRRGFWIAGIEQLQRYVKAGQLPTG